MTEAMFMVGLFNAAYALRGMECCGERGLVWRIQASYVVDKAPGRWKALLYRLRSFDGRPGFTDAVGQAVARIGYTGLERVLPNSFDDAYLRTGGWVTRNLVGRSLTAAIDGCFLGCGTPYEGKVAGTFLAYDDNGTLKPNGVLIQVYSPNGDAIPTFITFENLLSGSGVADVSKKSYKGEYTRLFLKHGVIKRTLSRASDVPGNLQSKRAKTPSLDSLELTVNRVSPHFQVEIKDNQKLLDRSD